LPLQVYICLVHMRIMMGY